MSNRLIISTGDMSDVDGFFALAKYGESTNADVLFIMNYPAHVEVNENEDPTELTFGLGYRYPSKDVGKYPSNGTYTPCGLSNKDMKKKLTYLGYIMCKKIWEGVEKPKGKLYFCIGGVNEINPFDKKILKNEVDVYKDILQPKELPITINTIIGTVYSYDKDVVQPDLEELLGGYTEIYIDFNGSVAFYSNDLFIRCFNQKATQKHIKGVFIMGGVLDDSSPDTMPKVNGVLNRMSCCTMNQFYAPRATSMFLDFIRSKKIKTYIITNNSVTYEIAPKNRVQGSVIPDTINQFLKNNGIYFNFLSGISLTYYNTTYNPPAKPFDLYTAIVLVDVMNKHINQTINKTLYYDSTYGVSLVSNTNINTVKTNYATQIKNKLDIVVSGIKNNPKLTVEKKEELISGFTNNTSTELTTLTTVQLTPLNVQSCIFTQNEKGAIAWAENKVNSFGKHLKNISLKQLIKLEKYLVRLS
jgi:hypothetical protein